MTTILQGIGWFLLKIYEFLEAIHFPAAYALALVIFTFLVKLVLFPLSYRGKKSMMKMNSLQGKMKRLEEQYANNRQKYQEEVQKLYQKENVNPMGGCLWSLLPLPILMGLYYIIRRPMLYMMGISADAVSTAIEAVTESGITLSANSAYQELQLAGMLGQENVLSVVSSAIPEYADKLHAINFTLFGIDLGQVPKLMFWKTFDTLGVWCSIGLFLIPLAVTALNFWYTRYSQKTNAALTTTDDSETKKKKKKKNAEEKKSSTERSNQMMMWLMPLMYLFFGYSMPAGMCVYMAVNALCTVGQDAICVKMLRKSFLEMQEQQRLQEEKEKEELAARKAEIAERRRLQEEANKANRGKKKKKGAKQPVKTTNNAGRIGIRTYALGRDYDPDRYGGVTPYRDPQELIDEQAVEEAYSKKRRRKAAAVDEAIAQAEETGDLKALEALEAEKAALEEAEDVAADTEETAEAAALPEATETGDAETPADDGEESSDGDGEAAGEAETSDAGESDDTDDTGEGE